MIGKLGEIFEISLYFPYKLILEFVLPRFLYDMIVLFAITKYIPWVKLN